MPARRRRPSKATPRAPDRLPRNSAPVPLTIEHVGGRGDGVATAKVQLADQWAPRDELFFVPFTLAGEQVLARPRQRRGGGVATDLLELSAPTIGRQTPPCAHFMACGGCQTQHMAPALYRAWKSAQVAQHLARADLAAAPLRPLVTAAPGGRRRLVMHARRLAASLVLGFHEHGAARIIDVTACPVATDRLQATLVPLRRFLFDILPSGTSARLWLTDCDNGVDLLIECAQTLDRAGREAAAELATGGTLLRLSWRHPEDGPNLAAETVIETRAPVVTFAGIPQTPPPGGFLQATQEGQAAIIAAVFEALAGRTNTLDLFAGCGTLTLPLAAEGPVHAVEGDGPALAALSRAARRRAPGAAALTTACRDLQTDPLTASELAAYDSVVVDPPRAGARAQTAEIAAAGPPRVALVSCNPATFARDARLLLATGYRCAWVQPIDQFLWSPHLELVAAFHLGAPR
ncbi:MAG: class I SAM-dependent RNA methyltransferase [Pseudomonadota bacterium]|nr:class I SAM-dependent RNA methyltransferase [Pseudomonadota bacterium]